MRNKKTPEKLMEGNVSIVDLRETPSQDFLDDFIEIYSKTFTDPREREDPAGWPDRMWKDAQAPQPRTRLLVALSADSRCVVGGGSSSNTIAAATAAC